MSKPSFSPKQQAVLTWWQPHHAQYHRQAIICDGAVRSGKTFSLSLSFVLWSFATFENQRFALCGKTVGALCRNLVDPLIPTLEAAGFQCDFTRSRGVLSVAYEGRRQTFYLFGGKDQGSADLIQGVTLAGVLFDEVALMPRNFVEQALARCSVAGARFWFNCNPEHPSHWFYQQWIRRASERNTYYLRFQMEDNPTLSSAVIRRYHRLYSGVFYQRYVLGKWTEVQGAVYPMFSRKKHVVQTLPSSLCRFRISCDYGTVNPTSMGLWGYWPEEDCWVRTEEYYHCSRTTGVVKTDGEYVEALNQLAGERELEKVIIDPSAASFIQAVRQQGRYAVQPADNRVLDGIRKTSEALRSGQLRFHADCQGILREFELYRWRPGSQKESPLPQNDHAMDDMRYFVQDALGTSETPFFALATKR